MVEFLVWSSMVWLRWLLGEKPCVLLSTGREIRLPHRKGIRISSLITRADTCSEW